LLLPDQGFAAPHPRCHQRRRLRRDANTAIIRIAIPRRRTTMARLRQFLRFLFANFGPLIAFWAFYLAFGIRIAIAATIVYVLGDFALRLRGGQKFTRIYLLSSGLAVLFGAIDLIAATPFMLKYEAVVTNVATGLFFIAGANGTKPLIQEFAEQRSGPLPERRDVRRYFQLFTYAWAAYFLLKAACYFALGAMLPLATALALRSAIGGISLGVMVAASAALGRRGFFLVKRLGWLPTDEADAATAVNDPR
jgi:intracellular septation protein A